ncbi:ATP-binding cassette domain-containing protein [Methylobacillus gramineus]|nr:ATP-binding cassette domain-containing protein [Methylobacillus gramineus]
MAVEASAKTCNILQVNQIEVIYEKVILAVRNVSLTVKEGAIVALLGANGAGKSTTLKAIRTGQCRTWQSGARKYPLPRTEYH